MSGSRLRSIRSKSRRAINLLVPTEADILAMSENGVLEITAGDEVVASYVDEFGRGGSKNRLLTKTLTATYFNAKIRPISYEFVRTCVRAGSGDGEGTDEDRPRRDASSSK